MPDDVHSLAAKYAYMQRQIMNRPDHSAVLREHITSTLRRCLPPSVITNNMAECCFRAVHALPDENDPLKTGAIHAWAGLFLQTAADAELPMMQRLHCSALKLLPDNRAATRDDLRLVSLDVLYAPQLLPPGVLTSFVRHRLGLHGPRLSCEEIALRMHRPLVEIHELESAVLTILSAKGDCHA